MSNKLARINRPRTIKIPRFASPQDAIAFATMIVEEAKKPFPNWEALFRAYLKRVK